MLSFSRPRSPNTSTGLLQARYGCGAGMVNQRSMRPSWRRPVRRCARAHAAGAASCSHGMLTATGSMKWPLTAAGHGRPAQSAYAAAAHIGSCQSRRAWAPPRGRAAAPPRAPAPPAAGTAGARDVSGQGMGPSGTPHSGWWAASGGAGRRTSSFRSASCRRRCRSCSLPPASESMASLAAARGSESPPGEPAEPLPRGGSGAPPLLLSSAAAAAATRASRSHRACDDAGRRAGREQSRAADRAACRSGGRSEGLEMAVTRCIAPGWRRSSLATPHGGSCYDSASCRRPSALGLPPASQCASTLRVCDLSTLCSSVSSHSEGREWQGMHNRAGAVGSSQRGGAVQVAAREWG